MKASKEFINELNKLLTEYENEVKAAYKQGYLTDSTARTYLLHSNNFVKWCKDDFIPGGKNK